MATTKIEWRKSDRIKLATTFGWRFDSGIIAEPFAIHITGLAKTKKDGEFYSVDTYSLTHTPTGKTICKLIPTEKLAKDLANQMNSIGIDWNNIRERKDIKGSGARGILDKFRKQHKIPKTIGDIEPNTPHRRGRRGRE